MKITMWRSQSLGNFQIWSFQLPSSLELWTVVDSATFLVWMCDSTHEVLLTREVHLSLGVQSLYWGSTRLTSVSSPFQVRSTFMWLKATIINLLLRLFCCGPKASGKQKYYYWAGYCKGITDYFPGPRTKTRILLDNVKLFSKQPICLTMK